MVASAKQLAKRAFLTILLEVARLYGLQPNINRESGDGDLEKTWKKVILRAHPDKGGDKGMFQKLSAARGKWHDVGSSSGRPPKERDNTSTDAAQTLLGPAMI